MRIKGVRLEVYFEDRKLDVLALSETKMKEKGESVFGAVKGRIPGVMNGRAREGDGLVAE